MMEELNCCINYRKSAKVLECLDPSPVSVRELPLIPGSCTNITGSRYPGPAGVQEVYNQTSTKGSTAVEIETQFSDSGSSTAKWTLKVSMQLDHSHGHKFINLADGN